MSTTGRNDPCPCGSGRKFKNCCLRRRTARPARRLPPELEQIWRHYHAGRFQQAEALCRQGLQGSPRDPDLLHALGVLAFRAGNAAASTELQQRAIREDNSVPQYYLALAQGFSALQRHSEAIAAYERGLALAPGDPKAHVGAGIAYASAGRMDEAVVHFEKATRQDPKSTTAHFNLGLAYMNQGRVDEAVRGYRRALDLDAGHFQAQLNIGIALVRQGLVDEALACFKRALKLQPDDERAWYNIGLALLYADAEPDELFSWHQKVASHWEAGLPSQRHAFSNPRDPERRLRIGYISPDFRRHSVAYFIEPVLAHHDRSQFETFCYFNHAQYDDVSRRIEQSVDHFRACRDLSDDQLAELIGQDGIDILVDLAGHMRGNRLPVFARKPAPVQVSYLGYPASTGLTAMDYRLVTAETDPPGEEKWHSEELYRLPRSLWCYRPPPDAPDVVQEPPALGNGFVTFCSMNNIAKLSPRTIKTWAAILREVPEARLVFTGISEHAGRAGLCQRFAAHGVEASRLVIHDRLSSEDYRALLGTVDIALDPFPYNGTTTTCETLWAGIPVVSLRGGSSVARAGFALLSVVDLAELAAADEAEYVATAAGLGSDLDRLRELRSGMRERMAASALRDERGVTRELEAACRDMWQLWCDGARGALEQEGDQDEIAGPDTVN